MALSLVTAGESHGPALVAIVSGLPGGSRPRHGGDRRGPAPAPAGIRPQPAAADRAGRGRGARRPSPRTHARNSARARRAQSRPQELGVGDEPVAAGGRACRARERRRSRCRGRDTPTSPGSSKYGLADVRDALERASARHTAVIVAAGAVAKALLAEIGIAVEGRVLDARTSEQRRRRGTRGSGHASAASSKCAHAAFRRASGSYATKDERLDARLAATLMGTQAVKGVEIGEGFALAAKRGSEAHDEILRDERGLYRKTNRAGGIEGGVSNGEEIVVRAAMKPLPTLMKPLASVDLQTGEPAEALVERSDTAAVEALAVVAEACVAWELARAAHGEVRRRRARRLSSPRTAPTWSGSTGHRGRRARPSPRARRASWARASRRSGEEVARLSGRPFVDLDREIERRHGSDRRALRARRAGVPAHRGGGSLRRSLRVGRRP